MNPDKIKKISLIFSYLFLAVLIGTIAVSAYTQDWTVFFVAIVALLLVFIPDLINRGLHIKLPPEVKLIFLIFICAALWFGNIHGYYEKFWWWDIMLHFFSATGLGIIGFALIFLLVSKSKIKTSYFILGIFSFSFALSLGAVWEIFEFAIDNIFGLNMQRSGLFDTMGDLIVDATGALLASVVGYLYIKFHKKKIITTK